MRHPMLQKLVRGDMRTTGSADKVVTEVLKKPELVDILVDGLNDGEPGVRMRTADALEKIATRDASLVQPHVGELIEVAASTEQQEVQWHMAQLFALVTLDKRRAKRVAKIMFDYYEDSQSSIVKAFAMTTLWRLTEVDDTLMKKVKQLVNDALESDVPSLSSRARRLVAGK